MCVILCDRDGEPLPPVDVERNMVTERQTKLCLILWVIFDREMQKAKIKEAFSHTK
jgi:hypothetical protein